MLNALLLAAAFAVAPQTASDSLTVVLPEDRDAYWQIDKARTKAPRYPQRALRSRTSGCAAVAFVIEADGSVSRAWPVIETARSGFGKAAVKSIETWQFTPGSQNAARKPVYTYDVVSFYITDSSASTHMETETDDTLAAACKLKGLPVKESAVQAAGS